MLNLSYLKKKFVVANGGVGGWGTIQSLNRFPGEYIKTKSNNYLPI